jgi:CheY-like chemotaxis protein
MSKVRILIVDDDPSVSGLVKVYLERTELYEVREVNCPAEAIAAALEFGPDAILLDIFMPGKDGGTVAREMAKEPLLQNVPIMYITTHFLQDEAVEREVIRGGMPFLAKSPNADALVESVGRLVLGVHGPMPADRATGRST